jgi:hypothetical protein
MKRENPDGSEKEAHYLSIKRSFGARQWKMVIHSGKTQAKVARELARTASLPNTVSKRRRADNPLSGADDDS